MKLFVTLIFAAILFAGCHKDSGVNPKSSSTGDNSNPSGGGGAKPPVDTALRLSHDDSIHLAAFKVKPQMVSTSVSGTNLILKFDENVDMLFFAEGFQKTSAIHLIENFKSTLLAGFDYTTVAEGGNTTLNWVDDNLNNVILKTITDTVVNNVKMVKINVHRPFTFFKVYSSNKDALNEQALFVQKTTDTVSFKSYSYFNQKNYLPTYSSAKLVYSK
jgi:hypothetical protein